jgi:DNA-directed RNA polymerase specialized sigma24 family protein
MLSTDELPALARLMDACKRGDPSAWSDFDRNLRPKVERALARRLGRSVNTADLAADVFQALWQNGMKRLRAFDPTRGTVISFFVAIGVQLWRQSLRSNKRRRIDRLPYAGDLVDQSLDQHTVMFDAADFSALLTDKSRTFFHQHVLNVPDNRAVLQSCSESAANRLAPRAETLANSAYRTLTKTRQRRTQRLARLWQAYERGESAAPRKTKTNGWL